ATCLFGLPYPDKYLVEGTTTTTVVLDQSVGETLLSDLEDIHKQMQSYFEDIDSDIRTLSCALLNQDTPDTCTSADDLSCPHDIYMVFEDTDYLAYSALPYIAQGPNVDLSYLLAMSEYAMAPITAHTTGTHYCSVSSDPFAVPVPGLSTSYRNAYVKDGIDMGTYADGTEVSFHRCALPVEYTTMDIVVLILVVIGTVVVIAAFFGLVCCCVGRGHKTLDLRPTTFANPLARQQEIERERQAHMHKRAAKLQKKGQKGQSKKAPSKGPSPMMPQGMAVV
ncbi:hypothetical protein KIPB_004238, partial [Kipferlia bialata]